MKKIFTVLLFAFFLSSMNSFAQLDFQKEGFSVRGALTNFDYITNNHQDPFKNLFTGVELGYFRKIGKYHYLNVPLRASLVDLPADRNGFVRRDEFIGTLGLNFQVMNENAPGRWFQPYAYIGFDFLFSEFTDNNFGIPVGAGVNLRMGDGWYLTWQTGFRPDISDKDYATLEHRFGFVIGLGDVPQEPEIPDTDMDGINDAQDQCPTVPGLVEMAGCPDTDGDGLADNVDGCPEEAGTAELNGCPDTDGDGLADKEDDCPEVAGVVELKGCPDSDGDGIGDSEDKCPNEAGTVATNGCPDSDGDGVVDGDDECPKVAGLAALNGCPDDDGDGVPNEKDRCPDESGLAIYKGCPDSDEDKTPNPDDVCPNTPGPTTNKGCPELTKEEKETLTFAAQAIQFETGSSKIRRSSYKIIDNVITILKKYPKYKCNISGHTDSIGSSENNQSLSENRARACYDYLVSKGIPASQLSHAGFGETNPIGDNKFKDGREKNRRVEFDIHP